MVGWNVKESCFHETREKSMVELEKIIRGYFPLLGIVHECLFTPRERRLSTELVLYGFDSMEMIAHDMGITTESAKRCVRRMVDKVRAYNNYRGLVNDAANTVAMVVPGYREEAIERHERYRANMELIKSISGASAQHQ